MFSVVFKVLMKWFFIIFIFCLHFFFSPYIFSTINLSGQRRGKKKKRNLTFPKSYAARKKKINDIHQQLAKTRGSPGGYKTYAWQLILSTSEILFVSPQPEIAQVITLVINSYMLTMACWLWELDYCKSLISSTFIMQSPRYDEPGVKLSTQLYSNMLSGVWAVPDL